MGFKKYLMGWISVVAVTQLVSCGFKSQVPHKTDSSGLNSAISDDAYHAVFTQPSSSCKVRNLSKACLNWMEELAKKAEQKLVPSPQQGLVSLLWTS